VTCGPADMAGKAAKAMRDASYSQLPVDDGTAFVVLLTAETVARWVFDFSTRFFVAYESSRPRLVEPTSMRTNMTYDTGPRPQP
jgi:hypothetical protein